jgi:hypothetical protein
MARFCFNADRKDAHAFLKTFYERVDVDFELNGHAQESCIILKDKRDKDIFISLNERLVELKGFSQPTYVPKWLNIKHKGPYFPQYSKEPYFESILYDKTKTKQLKLTADEEKYAFLYVAILIEKLIELDNVFKNNFWNDFKQKLGHRNLFTSLDEIDWTNVIQKYKKKTESFSTNDRKFKYGIVHIDDKTYSAIPFSVDDASIFFGDINDPKRGMIKRAISPGDVTLNLSPQFIKDVPNAKEFKEIIHKPGMRWAAKWQHPITKKYKYMEIFFTQPNEDDFIENYDSDEDILNSDSDNSDNDNDNDNDDDNDDSNEIDYPDYNEDNENEDEINDNRQKKRVESKIEKVWKKIDASPEENDDKIYFELLDNQEHNLPYSFIVSEKQQWEYMLEACRSGFRIVNNLGKVSNKILQTVADAASIALNKTHVHTSDRIKINNFIIEYADKRNV